MLFETKCISRFRFSLLSLPPSLPVFTTFWPLGLVAFGGPQAHVAILRDHLVVQRDWLDEEQFTELFAIGQVRNDMSCTAFYW